MSLQTYGAEVYGPLKTKLPSFRVQPMIPPGGLAYSENGNFLCVFWGQAPAWPVDYLGQIDFGPEMVMLLTEIIKDNKEANDQISDHNLHLIVERLVQV